MEQAFVESLPAKGISGSTLEVLEKEETVSVEVFMLLQEEHLQKLLQNLPIGQDAILTSEWQKACIEVTDGFGSKFSLTTGQQLLGCAVTAA